MEGNELKNSFYERKEITAEMSPTDFCVRLKLRKFVYQMKTVLALSQPPVHQKRREVDSAHHFFREEITQQ